MVSKLIWIFIGLQDEVWIVPISKALQWVQAPVPVNKLMDFAPWQCSWCDPQAAIGDAFNKETDWSTGDYIDGNNLLIL